MGARIWPEYGAHEYGAAYCRGSILDIDLDWSHVYCGNIECLKYAPHIARPIFASYFFYCFYPYFTSIFAKQRFTTKKDEKTRPQEESTAIQAGVGLLVEQHGKRLWQQHALANRALAASLH